jgi:hypothetical protein
MATCRSKAQCDTPLTRDFCVLVNDQNGPKVSRNVALVKIGHMLENPVHPLGTRRHDCDSENLRGAENQQERLVCKYQNPQRLHAIRRSLSVKI